jgi:hypothetical protein
MNDNLVEIFNDGLMKKNLKNIKKICNSKWVMDTNCNFDQFTNAKGH